MMEVYLTIHPPLKKWMGCRNEILFIRKGYPRITWQVTSVPTTVHTTF